MGSPREGTQYERVKDGIPRTANFCGWLRNEKSKKAIQQRRAFREEEVLSDV